MWCWHSGESGQEDRFRAHHGQMTKNDIDAFRIEINIPWAAD